MRRHPLCDIKWKFIVPTTLHLFLGHLNKCIRFIIPTLLPSPIGDKWIDTIITEYGIRTHHHGIVGAAGVFDMIGAELE